MAPHYTTAPADSYPSPGDLGNSKTFKLDYDTGRTVQPSLYLDLDLVERCFGSTAHLPYYSIPCSSTEIQNGSSPIDTIVVVPPQRRAADTVGVARTQYGEDVDDALPPHTLRTPSPPPTSNNTRNSLYSCSCFRGRDGYFEPSCFLVAIVVFALVLVVRFATAWMSC
ncbi:hypothetical protein BKA57DRAFT_435362 [Linnemannia elongata]|nr:hypothetical protein BKA57DRAFT_435362 [Linnemannia elongata]